MSERLIDELAVLIEGWIEEEKVLVDEIYFLTEHKFEFERKVKETIRDIVRRRRLELEEIVGGK